MLEMVSCEMGGGAPGEHGENSNEHRHQPLANHDPNNHANLVPKLPPHPARMKAKPTRPRDSLHPKPPIPQNRPRLAVMPQNARGNPCIPNHQSTKSKPCLLAAPATSRATLPPTKCIVGELPLRDAYLSRERYVAPQRHVAARASDLARENGRMTAPGTRTSRASPRCLGVLNTTVP